VKKILFLLSVLILLTFVVANCGDNKSMVGSKNNDNGKVPDPGGEFSYDMFFVFLTEEASLLDKVWAPSDFPEFAFLKIENIRLDHPYLALTIYLTEPSRDNVLRAIYYLRTIPEVFSANVARLEGPGGGGG